MRYCSSCHSVYPNEFRTCPKDQSELLTASELQPGMILRGKYEILGKLGAGGMAAVYRARHLAFGEIRAIKVVNNRLADDEDFLRRFRNEAVVARRLQHPNAVRVDDLDMTEDGRPFIVMEFVDGQNLREAVRHQGAFSLRRSVRIARQVASALAAAHELGIVHRDIKPDNILLAGAGDVETAKVLDFGIAKMKEGALGDSGALSTRTGMVVGTPQYISPEQAMGRRGSDLDGRADLYSLGVVLYEMVTGRLPFESDTAMGLILHHLQTPPPSPHELRPDLGIPDPLSAVVLRALQKDPGQRFRSATEMAAALEEVLALPLPEAAASSPGAGRDGRPLTPYPVPADIDRHETRVMPKTPPLTVPPPLPAAATAPRTPPPIPNTPVPSPTMVTAAPTATPRPAPTVFTPSGSGAGAWARTAAPPPLPGTAVFEPPRVRRKRRWFLWVVGGLMLFMFCNRNKSKTRTQEAVTPSPAAAGASVDVDARAARDAEIEKMLARALRGNPRTRRQDIDVEVEEGIVSLSGHAPSAVAHEAEAMARGIPGVREVLNTIEAEEASAAEPAPGPPSPPDIRIPTPPPPHGRPSGDPESLRALLSEARAAMKAGEPGEALGKYGAALGIDPNNQEARQGMKDATMAIADTIRRHIEGKPSPQP